MNKGTILFIIAIIIFILLLLEIPSMVTPPQAKAEIRAALDIGSGATNLKVAKVDPNTDKILTVIYEKSIPVPYQKHLEQSGNNTFDEQVMQQGIQAIKDLKEQAMNHQAKKVVAVATAAFRQAANAKEFASEVKKETGVKIRIISQDEEGILAFKGALAVSMLKPENVIVWDIGGGSMQLTTLSAPGTYLVEKGKTASIPFKNSVISEIKHEDPAQVATPNPMSEEEINSAIKLSEGYANEVNPAIKDKIHESHTRILAVGSLFNYGIKPLLPSATGAVFTDLEPKVMAMAGKSDAELPGGALAEVAVTNPSLVLGYMQGLHMPSIDIVSVNNADGALTYAAYWQT